MTTLIFPAVNQAALDYVEAAKERGEGVVCASSDRPSIFDYVCAFLPAIHDKNFIHDFTALRVKHSITHVLCPVASVYAFMRKLIDDTGYRDQFPFALDLHLIGKSPIQQELDRHKALMKRATALAPTAKLPVIEVAGILRQASSIYGESNDEKLAAMMGIFADAPKGDVVEIGCLAGRTAFVLGYMARRDKIGTLLTVDPWSAAEGAQKDSPDVLTEMTGEWDWDALAEIFEVNMIGVQHIHLRLPSKYADVAIVARDAVYNRCATEITSLDIKFTSKIAIIHIDGNHDYASVKQDCDLWLTRMVPGGWLILDDYVWAHGDGPRRAGDELLLERANDINNVFECGKALFVQFKETNHD